MFGTYSLIAAQLPPPQGGTPKRGSDPAVPEPISRGRFPRRIFQHQVILTVICKILFASVDHIRKVGFCNCQIARAPETKRPINEMSHRALITRDRNKLMKRTVLFLAAFTSFTIALQASPTPAPHRKHTSTKSENKSGGQKTVSDEVALSANGWSYVKGEWVHPDGYKYVNGKVLRTTARLGRAFPKPPGKLALDNAEKLTPKSAPRQDTKTAAEKAAEDRRKNLTPTAAPQTGTHL